MKATAAKRDPYIRACRFVAAHDADTQRLSVTVSARRAIYFAMVTTMASFAQRLAIFQRTYGGVGYQALREGDARFRSRYIGLPLRPLARNQAPQRHRMVGVQVSAPVIPATETSETVPRKDLRTPPMERPLANRPCDVGNSFPIGVTAASGRAEPTGDASAAGRSLLVAAQRTGRRPSTPLGAFGPALHVHAERFSGVHSRDGVSRHPACDGSQRALRLTGDLAEAHASVFIADAQPFAVGIGSSSGTHGGVQLHQFCAAGIARVTPAEGFSTRPASGRSARHAAAAIGTARSTLETHLGSSPGCHWAGRLQRRRPFIVPLFEHGDRP